MNLKIRTQYKSRSVVYSLLILFSIFSFSASAVQRDGVSVSLGVFYAEIDSGIASTLVTPKGQFQGVASFEKDLHLEDTSVQPLLKVQWNFKQKHLLSLNYFSLDRQSSTTNIAEFTMGENAFKAGSLINTKLDLELWQIKYGYAFYQTDSSEWGVSGGLHLINLDIGFDGTVATDLGGGLTQDVGARSGFNSSVPLPNIGTYYNYKFADDFMVRLDAQYFDISVDVLDARMISLEAGLEYFPTPEISVYTGLSYYDVKATYTQDLSKNLDIDWDVKLKYWGPMIALGYHF